MEVTVNCSLRDNVGASHSKKLRDSGFVPAIVYGQGKDNMQISIQKTELKKNSSIIFGNNIITLKGENLSCRVITKSYDVHPVTSDLLHVDFVFATEKLSKYNVPLIFTNQSACQAIKFGAILNIVKRHIPVKCKSSDLPKTLEFDIQNCIVGQSIRVGQIKLPDGVECAIRDKNSAVATVIGKKAKASDTTEEAKEDVKEAKKEEDK